MTISVTIDPSYERLLRMKKAARMKEKLHREQMKEANRISREKQAQEEKAKHMHATRERARRDWVRYNEAECNERFQILNILLPELCNVTASLFVKESIPTRGRPKISLEDNLYCALAKVYSSRGSRHSASLMKDAESKNLIERTPHFNTASIFLKKEDVTEILRAMLQLSACPLTPIEDKIAIDASGFRTTMNNYWLAEKHRTKVKNEWLKGHIAIGVKTNIITDAVVTDGNSADTKEFKELLSNTKEVFDVTEVYADKGYLSRKNYQCAKDLNITAFIPFKCNSTSRPKRSSAWQDMYYKFVNNSEWFYEHYHLRSNVETAFFVIKQKLGETLMSKHPRAKINELYCKMIIYNLMMLNQASHALDVEVDFEKMRFDHFGSKCIASA